MLLINKSNCSQIIKNPTNIFPIVIYQNMAFNSDIISGFKFWKLFEKFNIEIFKNKNSIAFFRSFALGDILQLIPVVRLIKIKYNIKIVAIVTLMNIIKELRESFRDILFYTESRFMNFTDVISFNLDGILEKDHNPNNLESNKHRVDIYLNTMGIENYNRNFNWNPTNLPKELNIVMSTNRKKIGLQIKGSTDIKSLPIAFVRKLAIELAEKYEIYLIHHNNNCEIQGKNIINTCGKFSVSENIALLTKLDCCITMDSGVLWMAHVANCPVLTILGPTRESERLTLHPQYPQKAKSINIAEELVGCKPCFETKQYCKGKINCMRNFDYDNLIKLIKIKINEILGE